MLPLRSTEYSSHEQGSYSRSPGNENSETRKKRGRPVTNKDGTVSKRLRMDVNASSEDSEFPSDLQDEPGQALSNEGIKFAKSVVGRGGTPAFNQFVDFLLKGEGIKYLEAMKRKEIKLASMSNILSGARANAAKVFKDLYDLWFDEEGNKTQYLKTLEKEGINLSNMSSVLGGAGANAVDAFKDLYDLWFDEQGNKTQHLKTLEKEGINLSNISSILSGARANAAIAFKDLYDLWFDEEGNKTQHLKTLEKEGISLSNMTSILSGARANAAKAFKDLYDLWFDEEGNKTQHLKTLEEEGISLSNMSSILSGARANAARAFKDLYDLWFDEEGNKTQHLKTLEKEGINLSNMSSILSGAAANAARAFKDLYDLWFDEQGNKTQYLKTLEKEGIKLASMSNILHGAGTNAAKAFKDLYDLWFDEEGNKTQHLKTLEKEGINLSNMSNILSGAGATAPKAFKELYDLWFNAEGNKTQYLKTLEKEGINVSNMSSILGRAGANASKAFKELYNTFFDEQGNKKQHLKHFIKEIDGEKGFTMHNLSSLLGGAGAKAKDAFKNFHSVCFNDEGKRTELLDDFYKAGFKPGNLSCMLCRSGVRASSILKKLHSVCFNEKREKTKLLDDFYNVGFSPYDLCNIMSAATDSLEKFHDFCFIGETKKYLSHFLDEKEGFTLSSLCNILHGAKANVCSALKDFHDVCFDETGNKTQLLADFYGAGFRPSDLSCTLSMAGNNATSILKKFHKSCFNKRNYLNHFLTKEKLFKPKDLSKILYGVGINICLVFEKLHNLCFDEAGNKKSYLNNLIRDNPPKKIPDILYEKVRGTSPTPLDDQNISEGGKATNLKLIDSSKQEQNSDSSQQSDSKKPQNGTTNRSKNRQDDEISDTVAGSSRDLSTRQRRRKKQIQSVHHNKKQQLHLSKFVSSIESVKQGLYLPSFEERGVKIDGKCVEITRGLSQALFLQSDKSFLSNLKASVEVYDRIAQGKQVSKREEREVFAFSKLLDSFERNLDSSTSSLPSGLIYTKDYKIFGDLSNYVAGVKGDFAIHLVTSDHVVAIYRTGDNYSYFDSNTAFVSGLKSVDQLMQAVEKGVEFAGYKVEEKAFLVEHFDVEQANKLLSIEDRQVLAKEIGTECQHLADQDKELGLIKVNGQELSRVQLYDFGTKINVEGSVPLLINADMNLSSKRFQDYLSRKEVCMTAREYLDHLKDSKNVEEVIQATKLIPFVGSKREIEEAEQTRKPKQYLVEQLVKRVVNFIANNLTTAFFASVSRSENQLSEATDKIDNNPKSCLSNIKIDNQLRKSLTFKSFAILSMGRVDRWNFPTSIL